MSAPSIGVAPARIGILGNPSDGYGGKAIAAAVSNHVARVSVTPVAGPAGTIRIDGGGTPVVSRDLSAWRSPDWPVPGEGLERLALAAVRRFFVHVAPEAPVPAVSVQVATDIPREVGLAGSSAVILATLRALASHTGVEVLPFVLAEQALAAELDDLGIACGAMDRVIQAYGGVMVMDLAAPRTEGSYRRLEVALPSMLVAWDPSGARPSGISHGDLRVRWLAADPEVLAVIDELRSLVDRGESALRHADIPAFAELIDRNFELRCEIFHVSEQDRKAVRQARDLGAAAKLTGSGGAVLVVPRSPDDLDALDSAFGAGGWNTFRPEIA